MTVTQGIEGMFGIGREFIAYPGGGGGSYETKYSFMGAETTFGSRGLEELKVQNNLEFAVGIGVEASINFGIKHK